MERGAPEPIGRVDDDGFFRPRRESTKSTQARAPLDAARCRGVDLASFTASSLAPASRSAAAASTRARASACINGVSRFLFRASTCHAEAPETSRAGRLVSGKSASSTATSPVAAAM